MIAYYLTLIEEMNKGFNYLDETSGSLPKESLLRFRRELVDLSFSVEKLLGSELIDAQEKVDTECYQKSRIPYNYC